MQAAAGLTHEDLEIQALGKLDGWEEFHSEGTHGLGLSLTKLHLPEFSLWITGIFNQRPGQVPRVSVTPRKRGHDPFLLGNDPIF